MTTRLAEQPRTYTPTLSDSVLRFRHPWVIGTDNKGIWVRIGVGKLSPVERGQLEEDSQKLLRKAPREKEDAPAIDCRVLDPYFKKIKAYSPKEYKLDLSKQFSPSVTNPETGDTYSIDLVTPPPTLDEILYFFPPKGVAPEKFVAANAVMKGIKDRFKKYEKLLATERAEVERLKGVIERFTRTMGEKGEDEKKLTVGDCLKHFEDNFRVDEGVSEAQRDDVLRRVRNVLSKLGHDKHYVRVTQTDLLKAITESNPKSARERSKRIQYLKRFCAWLCRTLANGGLGLISNPASELRAEGEKAIQAKRRALGLVSTLDPAPLLPKLEIYWRAFIAVIGYAGLRRSEAAGLTWDAVDNESYIIHVRANKYYLQLKTEGSERPVPPFPEVWKVLEDYRRVATHPELVFPRTNWERWTNPSWLVTYKGRVNPYDLTDELADALKAGGIDEKDPCRRLRRYWETRILSFVLYDFRRPQAPRFTVPEKSSATLLTI